MRAAVIAEGPSLELREVPEPEPGPGEVVVRVAACGICGSDLHMLPVLPHGSVMGHEMAGTVERVGDGVEGWNGGERVCVYPFAPLDHHDVTAAMASGLGVGQRPGAYAELVACDAEMLWRLPDEIPLEHGALVEPLAVALHGLDIAGIEAGARCAVLGCGPIGAMTLLALEARGVERVVAVEPNEQRRALAQDLGAEAIPLDGVHEEAVGALGGAPDVVLECAGHPSAPGLAVELVAPEGVVVLLGMLDEPVEISQLALMLKEAQIRSSFAYRPAGFDEAIGLLAAGRIPAEKLVTAVEPIDRVGEMFESLRSGEGHLKVLLRP